MYLHPFGLCPASMLYQLAQLQDMLLNHQKVGSGKSAVMVRVAGCQVYAAQLLQLQDMLLHRQKVGRTDLAVPVDVAVD